VLRLRPGSRTLETVIQNSSLYGIDGITFLNGQLYVNTVWSNALFRIPLDAAGKAGTPVQLLANRLLKSPDGMRAANGRMYLAENSGGQVDEVTISGDRATIIPLKTGLNAPTAVEVHGDTLWIGDRGGNKAVAMALRK
jgi:sugar lactone lactonase YvrE